MCHKTVRQTKATYTVTHSTPSSPSAHRHHIICYHPHYTIEMWICGLFLSQKKKKIVCRPARTYCDFAMRKYFRCGSVLFLQILCSQMLCWRKFIHHFHNAIQFVGRIAHGFEIIWSLSIRSKILWYTHSHCFPRTLCVSGFVVGARWLDLTLCWWVTQRWC